MAPDSKGRWRRLLPRLALAGASVTLALLGLEAATRLAWAPVEPVRWNRGAARPAILPELTQDDIGRPQRSGIFKGGHYRSNRTGLRGPDYPLDPRPGVFRIAIVGDSVVFGSGVDDDDTYAAKLQARLNRGRTGRYEVVNAGHPGLAAPEIMDRLRRLQRAYRVHLVVYGWTLNDIQGRAYQRLWTRRDWLARFQETRRFEGSPSHLLRRLWPRWIDLYRRVSGAPDYYAEVHVNYFENPKAWNAFLHGLDDFSRLTRDRGICGHVFLHTRLDDLNEDHAARDVYERVEAAAQERGLSVTQSFPHWVGRSAETLWVSAMDSHPNERGHQILADALFAGLERDLPPECLNAGPTRIPDDRATGAGNRRAGK